MVLMFALMAAFVIPNLGAVRARELERQAEEIAAHLEFARQRAIATGISHRIVFDLDDHRYRIEWQGGAEEPDEEDSAAVNTALAGAELAGLGDLAALGGLDLGAAVAAPKLDLAAPREEEREFHAVPGPLGRDMVLKPELAFAAVLTPGGRIEEGEATVAFESDGTAEYVRLSLDDESGRAITLEVLPLADTVRIHDEPL